MFGYKLHIADDWGLGLLRRVLVTGTAVNDTVPTSNLIIGGEREVWADKA